MTETHSSDWTVLVADDERGMRELLTAWLEPEYDLRVASDGEEAMELADDDVDLALLDRRMPGLSGDEVLERLRAQNHSFPVAMITAVSPDLDIIDMPFDDYVVKPVSKEELLHTVEMLKKRVDFDDRSRRFFRLASKKGKLKAADAVDHRSSEEYQRISREIEALRQDLDAVLTELVTDDPKAAFQQI